MSGGGSGNDYYLMGADDERARIIATLRDDAAFEELVAHLIDDEVHAPIVCSEIADWLEQHAK